jgi:hypothetical protein
MWGLAESAFGGDLESEVKSSVLFCFLCQESGFSQSEDVSTFM